MRRAFISTFMILLCLLAGCTSTYTVRKLEPRAAGTKVPEHAVYYSLPRSVITIDVPIIKTTTTPGPCANRQELLDKLGVKNVARVTTVSFKHGDFVVGSRTEPDPDQIYAVHLIGPWFQKRQQELKLSEAGLIQSALADTKNEGINFAVKTFGTVAGLAGKLLGAGALDVTPDGTPVPPDPCRDLADLILGLRGNRVNFVSGAGASYPDGGAEALKTLLQGAETVEGQLLGNFTGVREVTTGAIRCEYRPGSTRYVPDANSPGGIKKDLQNAEPAAPLYALVSQLGVTGINGRCTVPRLFMAPTGVQAGEAAIALTLAPILAKDFEKNLAFSKEEQEVLDAYLHDKKQSQTSLTSAIAEALAADMAKRQGGSFTLGSGAQGAVDLAILASGNADALAQNAVAQVLPGASAAKARGVLKAQVAARLGSALAQPEVKNGLDRTAPVPIELKVEPSAADLDETIARGQRTPGGKEGFFYRVPGAARITITEGKEVKAEKPRQLVPQFGVVAALPGGEDLNSSLSAKYQALFYSDSGALQQVNTDQTPVDASTVSDVGTAIGGLIDAREARKTAEETAADELTQLERRKKILEAEKAIRDLEIALGIQETDGNN